jgi:2-haloacid dehalogenase
MDDRESVSKTTLAFDVYGTLIDTAGVVSTLQEFVGGPKAHDLSRMWREKQLEYSFRRGLMRQYETFAVCTRDALDYACAQLDVSLTEDDRDALLAVYRRLPAFSEVEESLAALSDDQFAVYAFSNGTADAVQTLLTNAGIADYFLGVVSVDDLRTFKPNPDVYRYFLEQVGATDRDAWMISGNPFDVIGAMSAGMHGAWVRRSADAVFDPWGIDPTLTVENLAGIGDRIESLRKPSLDRHGRVQR